MQPQLERAQPAASEPSTLPQLERPQLDRVVSISPVALLTYSFGLMRPLSLAAGAVAASAARALTSLTAPGTSRAVLISVDLTWPGVHSG